MSSAQTLPTVFSGSSSGWEGSLYAFLAEKQRRSGSNRTPDSYYRTLRLFFGSLQKSPDQVSPQDVFSFAHGIGLSGREPSPVTVGARLSCISSFFKFLIRLDLLKANPCDPVERPKPRPGAPSGLSAAQVQQLLQVIPDTLKGRRDLAIVLTLVLTGRRRSEVINLTAGDIAFDDSAVFYRYVGKGGVRGRRELPQSRPRCHPAISWRCRQGPRFHASFRVALAGGRWPPGRLQRYLLQPLPGLPPLGRSPALRRPCPTPHRRQAPPRRRRVGRVRKPVPRPQLARRHHHLPPQTRGSARYRLAWRRQRYRRELARPADGLLDLTV